MKTVNTTGREQMPDIDIDFADREILLSQIKHRVAKLDTDKKHNTGVYVTECPHNPIDNLSTVDYKTAEERGYFKLDFLNVSIYKDVTNETHLNTLMEKEPLWQLLEHKPTSVEQLAATLAIIRPAKRHLANETWQTIFEEVWKKPEDGSYFFKKAHAFAYSMSVIVHMNLICEGLTSSA
jgi:hypothetical protein